MATKRGRRNNIWRRGNVWWIAWTQNRKRNRRSSRSTRKADAQRMLDDIRGRAARGENVAPQDLSFDALANMLLTHYRINRLRSMRRAENSIDNLREFFDGWKARAITPDALEGYVAERQRDGVTNATIKYELAALSKAFSLAVQYGKLPHKPYFPKLTLDNARQGFFEEKDLRRVVKKLPAYLRGPMVFAYHTGWRIGEILPLTWAQVDLDAGTVRLEPGTTKNRKGRTFPFAALPELYALIRRRRELTSALERADRCIIPWVFHREGRPIKTYRRAWTAACKAAGVAGRLVHDLRRTAVRNLERAGVPRSVAMKLTGHLTESVYNRYAIVSEADLREGVSRLKAIVSK